MCLDRASARLSNVSVTIRSGVTAIVGASGAGKTSILNLLVGFEKPDRGAMRASPVSANGRLPIFWVPQDDGLWPHLTVRQHLETVSASLVDRGARIDELLGAFDLADKAGNFPTVLSQGERARLSVVRALAADPAVLVMDEPLVHVDPARLDRYWQRIELHVEQSGASLVFAAHDASAVMAQAEQVICLDRGRVVFCGDVEQLYWRPPSPQLMVFLGDGNWLEPPEACLWIGGDGMVPACVRPEQLALVNDDDSPIVVRWSRFAGPVAQVDLHHEGVHRTRRFFHRPASNALEAGARVALRILVLVLVAATISACDRSGGVVIEPKVLKAWHLPPTGPYTPPPRSVSIGPDDQVIVLDKAGRVLLYDPEGTLIHQWRMPDIEAGKPEGSCWLRDGRIAVADTHYFRIVFFDPEGRIVGMLDLSRREDGQLYPVSIVQDAEENIFVSLYGGEFKGAGRGDRVLKFTRDGEFLIEFGRAGTDPGQFQRAAGMVWHDGRIYIADAANGRLQVFHDDGRFVGVLGEGLFGYPYDVDFGPDGNLYVVEWQHGRITRMHPDGRVLGRFGSTGSGYGQFLRPWSIAVDSASRVRLADTENRRIVELIF